MREKILIPWIENWEIQVRDEPVLVPTRKWCEEAQIPDGVSQKKAVVRVRVKDKEKKSFHLQALTFHLEALKRCVEGNKIKAWK